MSKKSINASDLFLAVLAILLLGVSFDNTWLGLEQIFGPSSFVIASVLSLLLLFLVWMIRAAKVEGKPTRSLVWIYIFIASFCFIANFNALYTKFMKTDIYTKELREINDKFNYLEADVIKKLNYGTPDEKDRLAIASKTEQLMKQIVDKGTPGFGDKAMQLKQEIEKLLKQKLTLLTVSKGDYDDLATRMGTQIFDMMDQLSPSEKTLKTDVENAKLNWNRQISKLLSMSKNDINNIAQGEIDKSLQQYNDLVNRSKSVLGEEKIKIEAATSKTQDVGKIGFAFDHAIRNFGMYQFVVLMGCILLDFVIVIIVLLVTPSNGVTNNPSVFGGNRKNGKVLIGRN